MSKSLGNSLLVDAMVTQVRPASSLSVTWALSPNSTGWSIRPLRIGGAA
jgi:hypothetical protein